MLNRYKTYKVIFGQIYTDRNKIKNKIEINPFNCLSHYKILQIYEKITLN